MHIFLAATGASSYTFARDTSAPALTNQYVRQFTALYDESPYSNV
ncbi:hypothetical protein [Burkholderia cepacia]|nr:hypothetical protein [Burkholderia cepacia]